jgi:hypothetical protein
MATGWASREVAFLARSKGAESVVEALQCLRWRTKNQRDR